MCVKYHSCRMLVSMLGTSVAFLLLIVVSDTKMKTEIVQPIF